MSSHKTLSPPSNSSHNVNPNIDIESTHKLLETIEKSKPVRPNLIQSLNASNTASTVSASKQIKKVAFDLDPAATTISTTSAISTVSVDSINPDNFNIMNFNIPKQTCYLALSMTAIGVLIWKLSKPHKKEEDK